MTLVPLFTSEVLAAHYDQNNAWLYLEWQGPQRLEPVQAAGRRLLQYVKQLGVRKVFNDNTYITESSYELVRWIADDYLPQAGQAGVEYVAWVHSPVLDCRSYIDIMTSFLGPRPEVAVFADAASAYSWLSSAPLPATR